MRYEDTSLGVCVFQNAGVVVMTDGFVHETVYHSKYLLILVR